MKAQKQTDFKNRKNKTILKKHIYALKQGQMLKFSVFNRINMYYIDLIEFFVYI
jgi:hypothetical protein